MFRCGAKDAAPGCVLIRVTGRTWLIVYSDCIISDGGWYSRLQGPGRGWWGRGEQSDGCRSHHGVNIPSCHGRRANTTVNPDLLFPFCLCEKQQGAADLDPNLAAAAAAAGESPGGEKKSMSSNHKS